MFNFEQTGIVTQEDFEIEDREPYIDNFIYSGSVTMIHAKPKQGKSLLILSVCNFLCELKSVNNVFYLDMDNSLEDAKERELNKLIDRQPKIKLFMNTKLDSTPMEKLREIRKEAKKNAYIGCTFVLDTIKDFIDLKNENQQREFVDCVKAMRDAGGTVIILHHSNSTGKLIGGSQLYVSSFDNIYDLKKIGEVEHITNLDLNLTHGRGTLVKHCQFSVDTRNYNLSAYNPIKSGLNDVDRELVEKALKALRKEEDGLSKSKLVEAMGLSRTDRRGKALADEMVGYYWRLEQINPKLTKYYIMEES